jgi:hypothetical protein
LPGRSPAPAREAIEHFLAEVYNRQRLHSALAYNPPAEYEEKIRNLSGFYCLTIGVQSMAVPLSQP